MAEARVRRPPPLLRPRRAFKGLGMSIRTSIIAAALLALPIAMPAHAAGAGYTPLEMEKTFSGPFGTFDRNQLKRGYQVYREVCAACHAMNLLAYRNLSQPGGPEFTEEEAKALAASGPEVPGIDNETGEAITRPAGLADHFPSPFPNAIAAKAANNGAYPPDLSLIAKGRDHGPDYIYSLLGHGYTEEVPEGISVPEGAYYNKYMPGSVIAMAPPLSDGIVEYAEADVPRTVEQYSKDVAAFLMWAAEPKLESRHRMGLGVMIFLSIMAVLFYLSYRRVWRNVEH
jgi:ubiquinol-cytochrome c reductase cytochrome b/c1 subunit